MGFWNGHYLAFITTLYSPTATPFFRFITYVPSDPAPIVDASV